MQKLLLLFLLSLTASFSFSQSQHIQSDYVLKALKATEKIDIDGEGLEEIWKKAEPIGDFWLKFPTSDKKSGTKTVVKAAYDEKNLYFLIDAFDSTNTYIAPSLKRDNSIRLADGVAIILDPINKKANGVGFALTPNNVQSEYLFSPNSEEPEFAWDNKWFSAAKRMADRYMLEIAIPFKSLRYKADNNTWGINFIRADQKKNEFSTWTNVPVQFPGFDIGYLGTLQFEGTLSQQKGNVSLIPYINGSVISDAENGKGAQSKAGVGFDAKIAVSPSLNLDLTVNPDFSNVDVDQQVTNLTRFSIFFPERRTFFLENSDIFSEYGAPPFRPFFSRTIGLDQDASPIPIIFGARLSGNLTDKTRIGIMNIQTGEKDAFAAQNYTAVSVHQRFGARSVIKTYFHNRIETTDKEGRSRFDQYSRNAGAELNLTDKNGINTAWLGYHTSMKEGITKTNNFLQIGVGHYGETINSFIDYDIFGGNYYADMGFINRLITFAQDGPSYEDPELQIRAGFSQMYNENHYYIRPKDKKIVQIDLQESNYFVWFQGGEWSDRNYNLSSTFIYKNTSNLIIQGNFQNEKLRYYFPLPELRPLEPGKYSYNNLGVNYTGDTRKDFIPSFGVLYGGFYNGKIRQYTTSILIRKQPWVNATLNAEYNDLIFPEKFGRTKFWLIGPKIEATFSNKLFWTTFLQFNTQRNNFNINSRIQYRYSPMSDFFLVYSDNYFSDTFINKNRAIVFKFNYWLTL